MPGAGCRCWCWCCELAVHVVETGCWCWCWCCELAVLVVEKGCWCWVPGAGAGASAVSWLCTWWRQVAGAGAGAGCRCWVSGAGAGAGAVRAVHVVETGCCCWCCARCGGAVCRLCRLRTFSFQPVACQQVVGFCLAIWVYAAVIMGPSEYLFDKKISCAGFTTLNLPPADHSCVRFGSAERALASRSMELHGCW